MTDFDALRTELTQAAIRAARHQRHLFHDSGEITVEYSLLGHLTDLLNAAVMVSHTIDRVRSDARLALSCAGDCPQSVPCDFCHRPPATDREGSPTFLRATS